MMLTILLLSLCCCYCAGHAFECRRGWIFYKDSCYGFGRSMVTFGEALATCNVFGGKLAEIETAEENRLLAHFVTANKADYALIGAIDIFTRGFWQWISTGNFIGPYVNWGRNEPNPYNVENCMVIGRTGGWADVNCYGTKWTFLCEAMPMDAAYSKNNVTSHLPEKEN